MTILSPSAHSILLTIVLIPCVAFGTMTHSSTSAPIISATWLRTPFRRGSQLRRMKRSGLDSHCSESLCIASMTGLGGEPYDPEKGQRVDSSTSLSWPFGAHRG